MCTSIDDHPPPPVTDGGAASTSRGTTASEQPNNLHDETEGSNMEQSPVHHAVDEVMDTGEQAEDQREDEVPAEELQPVPIPPPLHRLRHRRFRQPIE